VNGVLKIRPARQFAESHAPFEIGFESLDVVGSIARRFIHKRSIAGTKSSPGGTAIGVRVHCEVAIALEITPVRCHRHYSTFAFRFRRYSPPCHHPAASPLTRVGYALVPRAVWTTIGFFGHLNSMCRSIRVTFIATPQNGHRFRAASFAFGSLDSMPHSRIIACHTGRQPC